MYLICLTEMPYHHITKQSEKKSPSKNYLNIEGLEQMEITGNHDTNILNPVIKSYIREYVGLWLFFC